MSNCSDDSIKIGGEFTTPMGRRLHVLRFVASGRRARVYQTVEVGTRQHYALKILSDLSPSGYRSMTLEGEKVEILQRYRLPHVRVVEQGATFALKEWIEGIDGKQWLDCWLEMGASLEDRGFVELVEFFSHAATSEVHIDDLKPQNLVWQQAGGWMPVDPGLVSAPVDPSSAMELYREKFIRRWLRVRRASIHYLVYSFWNWRMKCGIASHAAHQPAGRTPPERKLLRNFSPQRYRGGLTFWGDDWVLPDRLQYLLRGLRDPSGADVEVLKFSERRSVFRARHVSSQIASVIVKGFPLAKLESRLKYRKYGLAEFVHYKMAAARGISLPQCHGYFEVRSLGLVRANGVLVEDLDSWQSLAELIEADPGLEHALLSKAIPVLEHLYNTGVNHIDVAPRNLLLAPDGHTLKLIDWQYCSFVQPRRTEQLLLQAAHFLKHAKVDTNSALAAQWLKELCERCDCATPPEALVCAMNTLQAGRAMSADARLTLCLTPETRKALRNR